MGLQFGRKRRSKIKAFTSKIPFVRFLGPGMTLVGAIAALAAAFTGKIDLAAIDQWAGSEQSSGDVSFAAVNLAQLDEKTPETIRIATFNLHAFGKAKSSDSDVMSALARIVSQFDLLAVQEVLDGDSVPIQRLVNLLNQSGGRYTATVSEPIGRTGEPESYAYLWDENRIQLVPQSAYVVMDSADRMHREPLVASFQVRNGGADGRIPFRFTLINVHTSPVDVDASAIVNEMDVLDDVFVSVRRYDHGATGEEDVILLGSLNVDTQGLRETAKIPGVITVAGDIKTTTKQDKTSDHLLIDRTVTREFTGRCGVLDFAKGLGLTEAQAIKVSDHLPLWAEFSAYEMPHFEPVAAGQRSTNR